MRDIRENIWPATLTAAALCGIGISAFNYSAPMTGVTGTAGALMVVCSSILLAGAGVFLLFKHSGGSATFVRVLALLGALGTILAAWFLHEYWLVAIMVAATVAAIMSFVPTRTAAQ
ncbi:MAG: hypothetical protein WD075_14690 [Rhodospirillales bacterium]